jgi:V/A-type H+-transporting ATPase subunit D
MEIRVNPTRMELNRLKKQLAMAQRGHKLLKDKRDELMRIFLELIRKNKELREEVEEALAAASAQFLLARAVMSGETMEEALMFPKTRINLRMKKKNIMSVYAPSFTWEKEGQGQEGEGDIYPYGFADTSAELDTSIATFDRLLPKLMELAEVEKTVDLLATEIEKTRRRVNALEHVLIPQQEQAIRFITMKLDEAERASIVRLMKVKDIVRGQA